MKIAVAYLEWHFSISGTFGNFEFWPLLTFLENGQFWPFSISATPGHFRHRSLFILYNIFEPWHQQNPNKWISWTKTQDHSPFTHPKSTESCDQMHLIYDSVKQGWFGSSHSWRLQVAPFLEFYFWQNRFINSIIVRVSTKKRFKYIKDDHD